MTVLLPTFLFVFFPAIVRLSPGRILRIQCSNCLLLHNWVNVTPATGSFVVLSRRSGSRVIVFPAIRMVVPVSYTHLTLPTM